MHNLSVFNLLGLALYTRAEPVVHWDGAKLTWLCNGTAKLVQLCNGAALKMSRYAMGQCPAT